MFSSEVQGAAGQQSSSPSEQQRALRGEGPVPPGAPTSLSGLEPVLFVKREQPGGTSSWFFICQGKAQKEKSQQAVVSPCSYRRDESGKLSGCPGLSSIPDVLFWAVFIARAGLHGYHQLAMLISLSTAEFPPSPPCMTPMELPDKLSGH